MQQGRRHFPFLLNISLAIVSLVLLSFGVLGFGRFGADTCSIILLNLDQTSSVVKVTKGALLAGIL